MKKNWKLLALVLAALLLCTACEERKVVDISDGGDMIGSTAPGAAPAAPAEETPEGPVEAAPAEEQIAEDVGEEKLASDLPTGKIKLVSISLAPGGSGMCLVPLSPGGVFVINNVLSESCTITSDAKDLLIADCTVEAEEGMDAELKFELLQKDTQIMSVSLSASLKEGENTIQVLIRLGEPVSGEYVGKLYINGEFIGGEFTGGETENA